MVYLRTFVGTKGIVMNTDEYIAPETAGYAIAVQCTLPKLKGRVRPTGHEEGIILGDRIGNCICNFEIDILLPKSLTGSGATRV
jgi:hypothetical protein